MVVRIIIAILFVLFAIVQLNDPDPWLWVLMYALTAAVYVWSIFTAVPKWLLYGGLGVVIFWMLSLLPDFISWVQMGMPTITGSMKAEAPHIELTREFLGLLICGLAWWWLLKKGSPLKSASMRISPNKE